MSLLNLKSILFLILLMLSANVLAWRESHGGDGIVSEFILISRSLTEEIRSLPGKEKIELANRLEHSLKRLVIESKDKLSLDGVEKDAVNFTLKRPFRVLINRQKWTQYENSLSLKELLVLHELLFTIKINDTKYDKSQDLYREILSARNK